MDTKNEIMIEKISEAFEWLNEDLVYVAMVGILKREDIDLSAYIKASVKEQGFDHWYEDSVVIDEDTAVGTALIPLENDWYMKFQFNSYVFL